jgi:hypothetical protein
MQLHALLTDLAFKQFANLPFQVLSLWVSVMLHAEHWAPKGGKTKRDWHIYLAPQMPMIGSAALQHGSTSSPLRLLSCGNDTFVGGVSINGELCRSWCDATLWPGRVRCRPTGGMVADPRASPLAADDQTLVRMCLAEILTKPGHAGFNPIQYAIVHSRELTLPAIAA